METEMVKQIEQLKIQLDKLEKEKNELDTKYKKLQHDYSENIIIQSMNDMKRRYEDMLVNTVSKYKYESAIKKINNYFKKICTTSVLLNHVMKRIKTMEQHTSDAGEMNLYRIDFELLTILEILQEEDITL